MVDKMRAILRQDLFNDEYAELKIKTCSEMLNHMPDIWHFLRNHNIEFKLSACHVWCSIRMSGPNLLENINNIRNFIDRKGWSK